MAASFFYLYAKLNNMSYTIAYISIVSVHNIDETIYHTYLSMIQNCILISFILLSVLLGTA